MQVQWFMKNREMLIKELGVDVRAGLSARDVTKRFTDYGENKLQEEERDSVLAIFFRQFQDFMVMVLMATTAISLLLGEIVDALAILAIIVMNAMLGFIQEYRAEKSLDALKQLTAPMCKVLRDGKCQQINTTLLVPGDVIILEVGDRIPADARILEVSSLLVNEAALTGESLPVEKDAEFLTNRDVPLGDQINMVFMGTLVTRGRGKALVVATGMDTEIGKIAGMIANSITMDTPLQARLAKLGKVLVMACIVIVGIVFVAGVIQGFPIYKMFLVGVSLAVAAIPEGLPAVVTIALAVGVQRMIRAQAIVRQLPAVETLGCATVICSDKTGTLTQNQMQVQKFWLDGKEILVTQDPIKAQVLQETPLLHAALVIGAVCNNAQLEKKGSQISIVGDPTEGALLQVAALAKLDKERLGQDYLKLKELPFDSERKRMSVLISHDEQYTSYVKGAPDVVLDCCHMVAHHDGVVKLSLTEKQRITRAIEDLSSQALRVLALAYRPLSPAATEASMESQLVFLGLVGMIDPPRVEAKKAIKEARRAGIRTIMITGDHKLTASAIANQLGLAIGNVRVMTGQEWCKLADQAKRKSVRNIDVFARVAPQDKLSIVRALQANGEIVGMTGDGVNDAPAVKEADIGISMGITGTDVTKEASSMILADDNFQTIIAAIREGRGIYDNIRKFIRYLLACNVGEVLTMFIATIAGLPLPLLPIQILWMNLVTDGLPAIALGVDPGDDDIMERPPRNPREGIFARRLHLKIGFTGFLISVCAITVFVFALWMNPSDVNKARTLAFTTLVMAQLIFVFQCRSEYHSIFDIGFFTNLYLVVAVAISGIMHGIVIYHPWFQGIFRTVSLTFDDWLLVFLCSGVSLVLDTVVRMVNTQVRRRISLLKVRI